MWDYIPIHRLQPMVWLDGQGLGRNNWKIGGKVNRTLWMSKKYVKIFVFLWMFTKGWPQQRRILIIKWIGWPFLWIPVSLFPQSPCHHPMGLWTKIALVAGMEVMYGLHDMEFHLPRLTWLWPLLSAQCGSNKNWQWVPGMTPFPHGDQTATSWEVNSIGQLPLWFNSYWYRYLLWIQTCFLCMQHFF